MKPVFGISLEEHLRLTQRRIAYPLELCVCVLLELGMEEEGLFRMAGGKKFIPQLKLNSQAIKFNNIVNKHTIFADTSTW